MAVTDRARRRGARRRRPARARFRDRFVDRRPDGAIYLDGNSLGRLPLATRDRLARGRRRVGRRGSSRGWHDWIDAARAGRRPARRARARRARRRGARLRLDDGQPLQALRRRARRRATPARIVTDRDNFPTDRYVLEGLAARSAAASCAVRADTPEQARARAELPTARALVVLSHVAYRSGALADMAALRAPPPRRDVVWDLSHSAGAVPGRPAREPASSSRSAAPTSTSTAARARPPTSTSRGAPGAAALADLGLVRPARPVRDGARLRPGRRHRALPGRHAADPRARRGRGGRAADRRGRHRRDPREVRRA